MIEFALFFALIRPAAAADYPLPFGVYHTSIAWTTDPGTGDDVLMGRVEFEPLKACPVCKTIRLIQIARVQTENGEDYDWSNPQSPRNSMRTGAEDGPGVEPGFFVDHDALKCAGGRLCSPYFRDYWNGDLTQDGSRSRTGEAPASLLDYPYGWVYFRKITLEDCAACAETGAFLGCLKWGGEWPSIGDRSLPKAGAAPSPSPAFLAAMDHFRRYYSLRHIFSVEALPEAPRAPLVERAPKTLRDRSSLAP